MAATKTYNGYVYEQQADGSWKRGAATAPQMPVDPKFPYAGPKAAADVQSTQVNTQGQAIDNTVKGATIQPTIAKTQGEAVQAGNKAVTTGQEIRFNGLTDPVYQKAITQFNGAKLLGGTSADLQQQFDNGPGKTHGVMGFLDWLPTPGNQGFNRAADSARGMVKNAIGMTGGENNTAVESKINLGPYIPNASDYDSTIKASIERLNKLRDNAFQNAIQTLGGVPDDSGHIHPVGSPEATAILNRYGYTPPSAAPQANNGGGGTGNPPMTPWDTNPTGPSQQVVTGGQSHRAFNPQASAALDAMVRAGLPLDQINATARQLLGPQAEQMDPARYNQWRGYLKTHPNYQGSTVNAYDRKETTPANRLASSGGVAALTGATNALGAGALQAVLPDQVGAAQSANPNPEMWGEVLGSIAPTMALSKGASALASRFAPKLLGGGKLAGAMRTLAPDVAYGALYGENTQGDPVTGAVSALVGSAAGNVVGKTLGAAVGGVTRSAPAQYLKSLNVPMTVGQQAGGIVQGLENRLSGIPVVGDLVKSRYLDSFKGVNRAGFSDAGSSIGFQPTKIGEEGVNALTDAAGNYYDNATAGVQVPVDAQFGTDLTALQAAKANLPPDLAAKIDLAMNSRVGPAVDSGTLTGEGYQQAVRGLKGYKAEATKPGFEADYRNVLSGAQDALTGVMTRNGGHDVVAGIKAGDEAYRKAMTLKKAVAAAKNGSASGENQVFSPAQLNAASWQTAAKFPGQRPFAQLADAAQQVLPNKVPDSGTAGRLSMLALPGLLGGGGYASDKLDLTDNATQDALTLGALLSGGGTKVGQKVLSKAIFDRPGALTAAGRKIAQQAGLFGHMATVPTILLSGPNG